MATGVSRLDVSRGYDVELFVSLVWFVLVAWLIARAFRQRDLLRRPSMEGQPDGAQPSICVIVPARDESANIARCVRSLIGQAYPAEKLRIVVIDDNSTDGTASIVTRLAEKDARIALLSAPALPAGWMGKVHACWIGATAPAARADWLCFIDADCHAQPQLLARAIQAAKADRIDLLSLAPKQELGSFAERLMIPCGLYLLGFTQNLARAQAPDNPKAIATGQFLMVAREVYDASGGHAAVKSAVCEDTALAIRLKRQGYRVLLMDGNQLISTRMYTGWATLWPGIAKNLSEMLGSPATMMVTGVVAVAMAWAAVALPAVTVGGCVEGSSVSCIAAAPAVAGALAAFALHLAGARHFRIPLWYGLLFPLGYTVGAFLGLESLRWRLSGRVRWKGRVYS